MQSKLLNNIFLTKIVFLFPFLAVFGQELPPIGTIDFYGLRTVSEKDVRQALKIKIGDDWMQTLLAVEENRQFLKKIRGVEDASISLVCCNDLDGKSIVFVGISEKDAPALTFRAAPNGKIQLPEKILQAGKDFQTAFRQAISEKDFSEDQSKGYALAGNKNVRKVQEQFVSLAAKNLKILRRVLRESADTEQRALAAQIIAYAPNKNAVVGDLLYAVRDANETVRNNATRALILFAGFANANPQSKIEIPADDFIPMLNSLDWTDRNKSLGVLDALTKKREAKLLTKLKKDVLLSLVEMARWKSPGHAQTAFFILGRIANFSDVEIDKSWNSRFRELEVKKFLEKLKRSG